ncbi:MAG TPA: DMT family transporter [Gemmataceae bacterium]|nr:DMT family transporter [Gemmataceae bacterium]
MKPTTTLPFFWMLLSSFSFALMGTAAHALNNSCDWQIVALARTALVLVFVAPFAVLAKTRLVIWRSRTLWMRSLAGSVSVVCTFFALNRLPVSEVLTLTNMFPIWVALLSWPLLRERPSVGVWIAVVSGVIGVVLIQQPHFTEGKLATAAALVSSLSTAVAMIGLHRLQHLETEAIVLHFSAVAVLFCVAAFFLFGHAFPAESILNRTTALLLLGVGLGATVGQIFLTKAFASGPPAKVSVIALTQIVFAMGLEVVLLHRAFNHVTLFGMGLVVAPTAWLLTFRA